MPVIHRLVVAPYPPAGARRPRQHMHALCQCQSTEASNNNTTQRGKKAGGDLPGDPDGHGNVGKVFGELLWFLQQGGNPSGFFARLREHLLQRKANLGASAVASGSIMRIDSLPVYLVVQRIEL